jgi:AcrR family transcriptional regulator
MSLEKGSRRRDCILDAVYQALEQNEYQKLSVEDIAGRAGVSKSTIYRWWSNKSELVFELFRRETAVIFQLDFEQSLEHNLVQQLSRLADILNQPIGRALLVVMAEQRDVAARFFKEYLLPKRIETRKLIQCAIKRQEVIADYPYELLLDSLYGPIHYQIIFFNHVPEQHYIQQLVNMILAPARGTNACGAQ